MSNSIQDLNLDARLALAADPRIDSEVQALLIKDPNPEVVRKLAYNKNIMPEIQKILSENTDMTIVSALATNDCLTLELQKVLAQHTDCVVRTMLVFNSNLTPEIKNILAQDSDYIVRLTLSTDPKLTTETQQILIKKSGNDKLIMETLAHNSGFPSQNIEPDFFKTEVSDSISRIAGEKAAELAINIAQKVLPEQLKDLTKSDIGKSLVLFGLGYSMNETAYLQSLAKEFRVQSISDLQEILWQAFVSINEPESDVVNSAVAGRSSMEEQI